MGYSPANFGKKLNRNWSKIGYMKNILTICKWGQIIHRCRGGGGRSSSTLLLTRHCTSLFSSNSSPVPWKNDWILFSGSTAGTRIFLLTEVCEVFVLTTAFLRSTSKCSLNWVLEPLGGSCLINSYRNRKGLISSFFGWHQMAFRGITSLSNHLSILVHSHTAF